MFFKLTATKLNTAFKALLSLMLCVSALVFSRQCADGCIDGIEMCLSVLIPSLFPFTVIASLAVKSGAAAAVGKPFGKVMRGLFGLSGGFAPVLLLSLIGGYPVGAKGIAALYGRGEADASECEKAAMFCVCSGPGFLINFIGASLYSNKLTGAVLLGAQIISVLILGILNNIFDRERNSRDRKRRAEIKAQPFSAAFVEAVTDGSKSMLSICAFAVLFSAVGEIISSLITDEALKNSFLCLFEVCSAVKNAAGNAPVETVAFAAGFGGLSVHLQILSFYKGIKINKLKFFVNRIIQGGLAALFTHLGLMLCNNAVPVFSTSSVRSAGAYGTSFASGAALVILIICFLYSLKPQK